MSAADENVELDWDESTDFDRRFAHMSNDSDIRGTGLEGYSSTEVFCDYLLGLARDEKNPASRILQPLVSQIQSISNTARSPQNTAGIIKDLGKAKKNARESVTFASGWMSTDEQRGHSIIEKMQYDKKGILYVKGTIENAFSR